MPRADRWLVVLARDPRGAKSRLATVLSTEERARLTLALLDDVLDAARGAPGARLLVATESDEVRAVAARHGAAALDVPARGTRAAARDAARAAARAGAECVALLPADLAALRADDVAALLERAEEADVVIAPDRRARGTNALVLRPPDALEPLFGPDSFAAHREAASRAGLRVRVVERAGLALDLDEADDLRAAVAEADSLGTRTGRVLSELLPVRG